MTVTQTPTLLTVRRSKIHGSGVFAKRQLLKGTLLIEYVGRRLSYKEYEKELASGKRKETKGHTMLYAIGKTLIDGADGGNASSFINHSCEPNVEFHEKGRHVWIRSIRDIQAGEELLLDYNLNYAPDTEVTDTHREEYACRCLSEQCRGTMLSAEGV